MNIDWNDAPDWANWAAKDESGDWYWHEFEPAFYESTEEWRSSGRVEYFGWEGKLIKRPVDD